MDETMKGSFHILEKVKEQKSCKVVNHKESGGNIKWKKVLEKSLTFCMVGALCVTSSISVSAESEEACVSNAAIYDDKLNYSKEGYVPNYH